MHTTSQAVSSLKKPKLIISIKEARKRLGKDAETLSDDQIEQIILTLTSLSSRFLSLKKVPK